MGKINYLLLLSIVFMLLMASRGNSDAVSTKAARGSTRPHSSFGTKNTNAATEPAGPAFTKLN